MKRIEITFETVAGLKLELRKMLEELEYTKLEAKKPRPTKKKRLSVVDAVKKEKEKAKKILTLSADAELSKAEEEPPKPVDINALFSDLVRVDPLRARDLLRRHGLSRFSEAAAEQVPSLVAGAQEILSD